MYRLSGRPERRALGIIGSGERAGVDVIERPYPELRQGVRRWLQ
jgi:hypothetical protein